MSEQQPVGGMYEEIDLRPYIQALLDKWWWILGAGLIGGMLGLGATFLMTPSYEATALVAITEPRFNIRFDPRLETTERAMISSQVYAELAMSDAIVQALYEALDVLPEGVETVFDLRELLTAESGSEASLLRLMASHSDPQVAAEVANTWATVFLERATEIYGVQGDAPLAFLESQLETTAVEVDNAERALVAFQEQNQSRILNSQLNGYENALSELVAQQQTIRTVRQEVISLRSQLANQKSDTISTAEALTAFLLQLKSYGLQTTEGNTVQLVVDGDTDLFALSRADQLLFLEDLSVALEEKQLHLATEIERLDPEIKSVQGRLQEVEAQLNQLATSRDIARETYTTLARTVEEARISSQDTTGQIQLASNAAVPVEPATSSRLLVLLVAVLLGCFVATIVVLVRAWWHAYSQ